jgi:hypothetical protein
MSYRNKKRQGTQENEILRFCACKNREGLPFSDHDIPEIKKWNVTENDVVTIVTNKWVCFSASRVYMVQHILNTRDLTLR